MLTPLLLQDESRWRAISRFRTSRKTDRQADEDAPGEEEYVIYRNLRAMPRAWVVPRVIPLSEVDAMQAMRTSQTPDGARFDAREVALVDDNHVPEQTSFRSGGNDVRVRNIEEGVTSLEVSAEHGGFLVLSQSYYPGWRAYVGGRRVPVYCSDLSLTGIVVPPGRHPVVFRLVPISLYAGGFLSVAALVALLALMWMSSARKVPWKRR